jgi:hypothetical protein
LAARPLVAGAKQGLVFIDLLQQIFECDFNCGCGGWGFGLDGHLSRGQAQVERDAYAFARRNLFDHTFEVDEFGAKDLQAFSQFFDLMLEVFLYGGSFMKAVTDVNVH